MNLNLVDKLNKYIDRHADKILYKETPCNYNKEKLIITT